MTINRALFRSLSGEWETPDELFAELDKEFHFALDVCATVENAKCSRYFTKEQDGLKQVWSPGPWWCNPPYGRHVGDWLHHGVCATRRPGTCGVFLLPARTDTKWFH